jgi:hypothetical protein
VKRLIWLALLAACSTSAARPPVSTDVRTAARAMLVRRGCGECHERHRPTAKPKALAVFDLDAPDWPARLTDPKRTAAALQRLSAPPAADTATFNALRDAVRSGS